MTVQECRCLCACFYQAYIMQCSVKHLYFTYVSYFQVIVKFFYLFLSFVFCSCLLYYLYMTKKQRESTAKYLYDISKGIALLAIIGNLLKEKWDIPALIFGSITAVFSFTIAYILEGSNNHE
ncbi:MAG: hypothetical protein A2W17_04710 [Planctomycetes bacterium RBG_16_41_13]|nr:MAG: hypothetical protein A2W17_04710 [Planctomycetes bacterium RBG_16_41_13]